MSRLKKEKVRAAWFSLGLNFEKAQVFIVTFAATREECQVRSEERKTTYGYDTWNVFLVDNELGSKLFDWLSKKGIPKESAISIIRNIGKQLMEVFKD